MKIIVVSDSHGDTVLLSKVTEKENDADVYIHCGDYCLPDYMMNMWRYVAGNCDWSSEAPLQIELETPLGKIHVEHGNSLKMKINFYNYVKNTKAYIFLSGHTHYKNASKIGDTYYFNPGSLTHPHDDNFGSYLVLKIDEKNKTLEYKFMKIDLHNGEISECKKTI